MDWTPERIEKFRKANGLTRKALGRLVGVTVTTVYQWERGLRNPSRTTQILLSKIEEEIKTKKGKEGKKSWGSGKRKKAG
jgi:DNA-binding transcriptional regulator YiaG